MRDAVETGARPNGVPRRSGFDPATVQQRTFSIVHRLTVLSAVVLCLAISYGCSSKAGSTTGGSPDGGGTQEQDAASNDGASSGDSAASMTFDQFQVHNLDVLNMYRATLNVAPLLLDHELCTFALAGSQELSMDHTPHEHFINAYNDGSILSYGFGDMLAENQGDPNGWTVLALDPTKNELAQIDATLQYMFNEGPGSDDGGQEHDHYVNLMNPVYTRLGVGLLEVGGRLYLTNDFSD
jgi:uncharacterized protein YkwD